MLTFPLTAPPTLRMGTSNQQNIYSSLTSEPGSRTAGGIGIVKVQVFDVTELTVTSEVHVNIGV
jgi:hypothetical protein